MIKLVSDSTAYLPEEVIRRHDIRLVPLYVHFGEEAFREGVDLSHRGFYERLKKAPALPTTSQPSAGEFHQVLHELCDAGHEVVVLTISSKLSGTWNSAMAAKEMLPDAPISVVDTLSTSIGLELLIQLAAEAIAGGASRQEVVELLEARKNDLYTLFVVDTLEYLAKGGRIGAASAFVGTMLKIKPILILKEGAIHPLEKVRSKGKAVARMIELVEAHAAEHASQAAIAITHALAAEEAEAIRSQLAARLGCRPPSIAELGPVIGTHTGPGVVGVSCLV